MKGRKLFSLLQADGVVTLYAEDVETGLPAADDVIIRIDAAPINPSDLALLIASADLATLRTAGTADRPVLEATIPAERRAELAGRVGTPMAVGNEGAGVVIAAGENVTHLIGKTVACLGHAMYAEYIRVPAKACYVLPDGITAVEGAASLVNPLTALAMTDTMRAEGHAALVHTAAASSLGQMLNRICIDDGIPLVNVVRRKEQADLLRSQGAQYVCVSSDEDFSDQLVDALEKTRATIAFDAIGSGALVNQLLDGMETVALRHVSRYSRYGSMTRKTVYVYGCLDDQPIQIQRGFDFSWNVAGWLLPMSQQRKTEAWKRVSQQMKTTFSTRFSTCLSLDDVLVPSNFIQFAQKATGQKFLITPNKPTKN
ncbi:hypothetical protein [Niveispirillum sp.]|uniref:alcohol dehydrogenase catalytic domain-containing protein n=1 Tax=Niveispirillum sp. TaxID=1917217 RepID=UPI001B4B2FD1|nr:hypothetical protein [Niveispirillum sp.]MBP7337896.1 hypothetical protein [Niveispirillum sp.]